MLTSGASAGLQELLASYLAKDRNKHGNYFTSRVPKTAAFGALVSAPLGHFMIWLLQKAFKGRTSLRAKIVQILVSNLVVSHGHLSLRPCYIPANLYFCIDCTNTELRVSCGHRIHRRGSNISSSPRDRPCGIHESHEGLLDHGAYLPCLCSTIPTRGRLDAFLQLRLLCYRYIYQYRYEEEAARRPSQEALW